jgi:hypothetical protein
MSTSKIVANNLMIYPKYRNQFSEEERTSWRIKSFNTLGNNIKYTYDDLKSLPNTEVENDISKMTKLNFIQEKLILGEIVPEQIVFLSFDSNIVCRYDTLSYITKVGDGIKTTLNIEDPIIIYIDTFISKIENRYKQLQKEDYDDVNFTYIENYFKFVKDDEIVFGTPDIDYIHNVCMKHACKVLDDEEGWYFSNSKCKHIKRGAKQEINDNAQLSILLQFRDSIIGSNLVFLTLDKGLQKKCKTKNIYVSLS